MSSYTCEPANILKQIYQIFELIRSIAQIIGDIQLLCGATVGQFIINFFRLLVGINRCMVNILFLSLPFSNPFERVDTARNTRKNSTNDVVDGTAENDAKNNTTAGTSKAASSEDASKRLSSDTESLLTTGFDGVIKNRRFRNGEQPVEGLLPGRYA